MRELRMPEKRNFKRLKLKGNVLIKARDGNSRLLKASVDNLSWGGLHLRLPQALDVNDDVDLELITKFSESPLIGRGIIRRVDKPKSCRLSAFSTGVEFVDVDRRELKEVIKQNLKREHKINFRKARFARDIFLVIKIAPLLVLFSWLVVKTTDTINLGISEWQQYSKESNKAVIYYLDHLKKGYRGDLDIRI